MLKTRLRRSILGLALAAACLAAPVESAGQAAIRGRVVDDETGAAVPGARLELAVEGGRIAAATVTDATGGFQIWGIEAGRYLLRVDRLGYREATIALETGATLDVVLRLTVEAVKLEPLEVPVRAGHRRGVVDEFERRRARGIGGAFLAREQIARHSGASVLDLLRLVPGLKVSSAFGVRGYLVSSRTGCAPAIYLDGAPLYRPDGASAYRSDPVTSGEGPLGALALVHPRDLHGIEVYTGPSQVPAEFGGSTALCGVIALWTRRGD